MDELGPLELPAEVWAELDAMPAERRHACMEQMHAQRAFEITHRETMLKAAAMLDETVQTLRHAIIGEFDDQPEATQNEFLDYLMASSMRADWARALARRDDDAAEEYRAKAEVYEEQSKDFRFRFPKR
jgi:hypothetical protein